MMDLKGGIRQRKRLICKVVAAEASVNTKSPRAGVVLQRLPKLSQRDGLLNFHMNMSMDVGHRLGEGGLLWIKTLLWIKVIICEDCNCEPLATALPRT